MALHFSRRELAERRRRACAGMVAAGLDGLLLFRQESMYYLTGYDTSGYSLFQGMYLGADGQLALCTRSADVGQARLTSVVEDVRIWRDREGANPAEDLRAMLADPAQEMYGLQICTEAGLPSGTIHPILARLEHLGWAESRWEEIDARAEGRPRRRYYRLTKDGAELARDALARATTPLSTVPGLRARPAGGLA